MFAPHHTTTHPPPSYVCSQLSPVMCLQTPLSLMKRVTSRPVLSGEQDRGAAACGYPQSIYIWSSWWEVCSFFPISELLEVIRTLKCEELSLCIKVCSSGRCMPSDMLRRGRGWRSLHPNRLLGHWGPYKTETEGEMYSTPSARGQEVGGEGGSSSQGPLQSQDRFMHLPGQSWGRYLKAISKYDQEASREKNQKCDTSLL